MLKFRDLGIGDFNFNNKVYIISLNFIFKYYGSEGNIYI